MKKTKMLKKNYEFKYVLSKGKYFSNNNIEAVILNNNKNYNLLGLAISTKIGKAVKRNMLKRMFRESYSRLENNIKTGVSIVFLWKKNSPLSEATYKNINREMVEIFEKSHIYNKEESV